MMRIRRPFYALIGLILFNGCGRTPPNFVERPPLKDHAREVTCVVFAPDGLTLASRGADSIKVWNLARGVEVASYDVEESNFGTVAFSPVASRLATEQAGKGAIEWDLTSRSRNVSFTLPPDKRVEPKGLPTKGWGLAYSPDGSVLVGGGSHGVDDGFLTFWHTDGGVGVESVALKRPITTVAFAPDGRTIASGSMDGKITIWDRGTRQILRSIDANRSYLAPVVFSPDGRVVASANEARWVKLWDPATGREVGTFKGHIKAVLSMNFHPDGRTLVSGDSGGTLFVWDVASRKMMTRLESGELGKVWSLAFSPDGKILAAGSEDKLVHLWDVSEAVPDPKNPRSSQ